jgi:hypothetical protein
VQLSHPIHVFILCRAFASDSVFANEILRLVYQVTIAAPEFLLFHSGRPDYDGNDTRIYPSNRADFTAIDTKHFFLAAATFGCKYPEFMDYVQELFTLLFSASMIPFWPGRDKQRM